MQFTLHYLFQSGWLVESEADLFLFDYWRGQLPAFCHDPSRSLYISISHGHGDHFNAKAIAALLTDSPAATLIYAHDIPKEKMAPVLQQAKGETLPLFPGESASTGGMNLRAFGSTDAGISLAIEYRGLTIFHAGDLNLWHWPLESTAEEIDEAISSWETILEQVATAYPQGFDLVFFPIDARQGGDYDRGAREFARRLKPHFFCGMHYERSPQEGEPFQQWAAKALPEMQVILLEPGASQTITL